MRDREPLFTDEQLSMMLSEASGPGLDHYGYDYAYGRPCIVQAALNTRAKYVFRQFKGAARGRVKELVGYWDSGCIRATPSALLKACENA